LLRCYISTNFLLRHLWRDLRQSHFVGEKLLLCFSSIKNCSDISGEVSGAIHVETVFFASNRFLLHWYIYRSKSGAFFASWMQFRDFSVKRFCFIHTIFFCYNKPFSAVLVKAGLGESRETYVSTRGRRIATRNPSEDTQSFPRRKMLAFLRRIRRFHPPDG
jgi:hypothetical protein